tara:strand:- start:2087 stop:2812 length:726 start_codon:yes stop_codon:yes gene_type:complete
MTLPGSGSLSYNSIRAEFGSPSSNVYLSLYYRGGPYTYAIPQNANITTSSTGSIAVNDFYGSSGKGPFLQFNGGSYNTGGKAAIQYYGGGGPNLPAISDTSFTIGPTGYSVPRFYAVGSATVMFITGQPDTNITNATTWSQRNFYCYNTSGSLVCQFRCGWAAGRGQMPGSIGTPGQQPRPKGSLVIPASTWVYESTSGYPANNLTFASDSALSTTASQPTPSFVVGNSSALAQNLVVKAN